MRRRILAAALVLAAALAAAPARAEQEGDFPSDLAKVFGAAKGFGRVLGGLDDFKNVFHGAKTKLAQSINGMLVAPNVAVSDSPSSMPFHKSIRDMLRSWPSAFAGHLGQHASVIQQHITRALNGLPGVSGTQLGSGVGNVLDRASEELGGGAFGSPPAGSGHVDPPPAHDPHADPAPTPSTADGDPVRAPSGEHGQCLPDGPRDQCLGYDDNVHSEQICDSLLCCWAPSSETWRRSCFARTAAATAVAAGAPPPPPGDATGGSGPLILGACSGDKGVCFTVGRGVCSLPGLGLSMCPDHASAGNVDCCPTGANLSPALGSAPPAGVDPSTGGMFGDNTAPGSPQATDNSGTDELADEEADPEANGDIPQTDAVAGDNCGVYEGASQTSIKGNDGNYMCVKIAPQHFTNPSNGDDHMKVGTACAFDRMFEAAKAQSVTLTINSGFRTFARQQYFWKKNGCTSRGNCRGNLAAVPGTSRHGIGSALDISVGCGKQPGSSPFTACINKSAKYKWLRENAMQFGFVRTVRSEPWHWEYKEAGVTRAPGYQ